MQQQLLSLCASSPTYFCQEAPSRVRPPLRAIVLGRVRTHHAQPCQFARRVAVKIELGIANQLAPAGAVSGLGDDHLPRHLALGAQIVGKRRVSVLNLMLADDLGTRTIAQRAYHRLERLELTARRWLCRQLDRAGCGLWTTARRATVGQAHAGLASESLGGRNALVHNLPHVVLGPDQGHWPTSFRACLASIIALASSSLAP